METIECIKTRMSIRKFMPDPVPKEKLMDIINTAQRSPSYKNSQPWEVIILSGDKKQALSKRMGIRPTHKLNRCPYTVNIN